MKRWSPVVFLGGTLLAKTLVHSWLWTTTAWPPNAGHQLPQALEAFAFLSGPACLCLFWLLWRRAEQSEARISILKRRAGTATLTASVLLWLFLVMQWLQAAWVAGTPTKFPQYWVERSFKMYLSADICLLVGGLLSFWLKDVRMPPRLSSHAK
jgi:hypothetical protein